MSFCAHTYSAGAVRYSTTRGARGAPAHVSPRAVLGVACTSHKFLSVCV